MLDFYGGATNQSALCVPEKGSPRILLVSYQRNGTASQRVTPMLSHLGKTKVGVEKAKSINKPTKVKISPTSFYI